MTLSSERSRTKIVATVGPASLAHETLLQLIEAGVNVFRINMAHGSRESHNEALAAIRKAADEHGQPIGVLVDLAGPKIRLGELFESPLECGAEDQFHFVRPSVTPQARHELPCTYAPLVDELEVGDNIVLADGAVAMKVIEIREDRAVCAVEEPGVVKNRQGVNLPGVALSTPSLTEADRDNAVWAAQSGVDFIGLSFVRTATEVAELKEIVKGAGGHADVVAKIEKGEALQCLTEIAEVTDAMMVARGDLGVEIDVAETPVAQKQIIDICAKYRRPVIVATQMLDSMQNSRRPTRAEASDVANAILDGADACMLSGETAVGKYPVDTVKMMRRIMHATETLFESDRPTPPRPPSGKEPGVHPITAAVAFGAGRIAERLSARLVVIATRSGQTARVKAKQREYIPSVGVSESPETLRKMTLFWGIFPLAGTPVSSGPRLRKFVEDWAREQQLVRDGDRIVYVTGSHVIPQAHNVVVVHEVGDD